MARNKCSIHPAFPFTAGEKVSNIFLSALMVEIHNFTGHTKLNILQSQAIKFCVKIGSFIYNW